MTLLYFVDLFQLDKDANQRKIATFKLQEGSGRTVEVEGEKDNPILDGIRSEGIFDYKNSKPGKLFPEDGGIDFMENLKYQFRSGYLSATDVQKKTID